MLEPLVLAQEMMLQRYNDHEKPQCVMQDSQVLDLDDHLVKVLSC